MSPDKKIYFGVMAFGYVLYCLSIISIVCDVKMRCLPYSFIGLLVLTIITQYVFLLTSIKEQVDEDLSRSSSDNL